MSAPLTAWSTAELETAYANLTAATSTVRALGRWHLAAMLGASKMEVYGHLASRATEERDLSGRQLALVPPGAYDHAPWD